MYRTVKRGCSVGGLHRASSPPIVSLAVLTLKCPAGSLAGHFSKSLPAHECRFRPRPGSRKSGEPHLAPLRKAAQPPRPVPRSRGRCPAVTKPTPRPPL